MDLDLDIVALRQKCSNGQIKWSTHALARMQERGIEPTDVINCIDNGKIIEQYPQAYPYPACLVLGAKADDTHIHVVAGYDSSLVWVITAYEPDENVWTNDYTERKEQA